MLSNQSANSLVPRKAMPMKSLWATVIACALFLSKPLTDTNFSSSSCSAFRIASSSGCWDSSRLSRPRVRGVPSNMRFRSDMRFRKFEFHAVAPMGAPLSVRDRRLTAACRRLYDLPLRVHHANGGTSGCLQGSLGRLGVGTGDVHRLAETLKLPESIPGRPGGLDLNGAAIAFDVRTLASVVWDTLLAASLVAVLSCCEVISMSPSSRRPR